MLALFPARMDNNIPSPAPSDPAPTPPAPPPPAPAPEPAPPAAARAVLDSPAEDAARIRADLEEERRLRKNREGRINELEDENFRLKKSNSPEPTPRPRKRSPGLTLLHDED